MTAVRGSPGLARIDPAGPRGASSRRPGQQAAAGRETDQTGLPARAELVGIAMERFLVLVGLVTPTAGRETTPSTRAAPASGSSVVISAASGFVGLGGRGCWR